MLYNIRQTNKELLPVIQKYGCLFLCFAYKSPLRFEGKVGCLALNNIWETAEKKGIISGDLNHDGDYDEDNEAVILDHNKLASLFDIPVKYDDKHHAAEEKIPPSVSFIFGQFYWKSSHFTVLNHKKEVEFDPTKNSNTVKYGKLKTMRWYYNG